MRSKASCQHWHMYGEHAQRFPKNKNKNKHKPNKKENKQTKNNTTTKNIKNKHVWEARMTPGLVEHAAILHGLKHSAEMDVILDAFPDADSLPTDAARAFSEASWGYANCQNAVADHYNRVHGMYIFDVTIKTHYMLHQALQAGWFNPRKIWNYAGEDFMHTSKVLLQSCVQGNSAPEAQNKFGMKYCYALHYMFLEFEEGLRW